MKGDLHCHSCYSDGSETVEDIIKIAKQKNLDFIAITDHDTITVFDDIDYLQNKYNITIIPALEVSAFDFTKNKKVHFLCYNPKNLEQIKIHCQKLREARQKSAEIYIENAKKDFDINPDDVYKYAKNCITIYKQHLMEALIKKGFTDEFYGDLFKELFGKNGRYPKDLYHIDVYDALKIIKSSGGVCVLAHPYEYDSIELMHELIQKNLLDGIEVFHSRCSEENEKYLHTVAQKHNLIETAGSDFHGRYNSRKVEIADRTTDENTLNKILNFTK